MAGKTVSRRQFLKHAGATAALLGLSEAMIPQVARALEELTAGKEPIIWLQGQNCTACSVSFLNTVSPSVTDLVLNELSVRYHPTVMAAAGETAIKAITDSQDDPFVLVVEGSIPYGKDHREEYCTFGLSDEKVSLPGAPSQVKGDKSIAAWVKQLAPKAAAVIANGSCASFGGIPAANASVTGASSVEKYLKTFDCKTPVINVGGCPSHPDWFVGTVLEVLLLLKKTGKIDKKKLDLNRHSMSNTFFGQLIHENCERRAAFDSGLFLEDWNDENPDMKLCLFKMGCKGPVTYADCGVRRWNSKTNWCIGANAPCHGCASPDFYKNLSPLYNELANVNFPGLTTAADTAGWIAAGATAVGIGTHYLLKQLGEKPEENTGGGEE